MAACTRPLRHCRAPNYHATQPKDLNIYMIYCYRIWLRCLWLVLKVLNFDYFQYRAALDPELKNLNFLKQKRLCPDMISQRGYYYALSISLIIPDITRQLWHLWYSGSGRRQWPSNVVQQWWWFLPYFRLARKLYKGQLVLKQWWGW